MDEFAQNLTSPAWWVGVVVVGILINLVSAYAKPVLDRITSNFGERWKKRSTARRTAYENEIFRLVENGELRRQYEFRHLSYMLRALVGIVFAVFLVAMKLLQAKAPELSIAHGLGVSSENGVSAFYFLISMIVFTSINMYIVADSLDTKLRKARDGLERGDTNVL